MGEVDAMLQVGGLPAPEELRPDQLERRDRIVRAALKALIDGEYDSVKISDVARSANVALGTMYRYFASKEHLFGAAYREWQQAMRGRMERVAPAGETEHERLRDLFHRSIRAFQVQPQFYRVLMMLETTSDAYAAAVYQSLSALFDDVAALAFGAPVEGERRAILVTVQSVLDGSLRRWVTGRGSADDIYRDVDNALALIYR